MRLRELRKNWFPLVLAVAWVVLSAVTLHDFAGFASATHQEPPIIITSARVAKPLPHGRTVKMARD